MVAESGPNYKDRILLPTERGKIEVRVDLCLASQKWEMEWQSPSSPEYTTGSAIQCQNIKE